MRGVADGELSFGGSALNATTKFYTGFFIAVALVVALSYYVGYRAGVGSHHRTSAVARPR